MTRLRLVIAAALAAHGFLHVVAFDGAAPVSRGARWEIAILPDAMMLILADSMVAVTTATFVAAAIAVAGPWRPRVGALLTMTAAVLSLLTFVIAADGLLHAPAGQLPGILASCAALGTAAGWLARGAATDVAEDPARHRRADRSNGGRSARNLPTDDSRSGPGRSTLGRRPAAHAARHAGNRGG